MLLCVMQLLLDYTIGSEDLDTFASDKSCLSYAPDVVDVSGNAIATDLTISDFDNVTNHVIDTTAPQLTIQTYVSSELVLAFNEAITDASATGLETAVAALTEVTELIGHPTLPHLKSQTLREMP